MIADSFPCQQFIKRTALWYQFISGPRIRCPLNISLILFMLHNLCHLFLCCLSLAVFFVQPKNSVLLNSSAVKFNNMASGKKKQLWSYLIIDLNMFLFSVTVRLRLIRYALHSMILNIGIFSSVSASVHKKRFSISAALHCLRKPVLEER